MNDEFGRDPLLATSKLAASKLASGLYVTATPIGNAADVTLRALKILQDCDAIVAEDTRVTSRLLSLHGIVRPLLVYNDHNAASMRGKLLARLREGARLALVSDAGTPLVSDPGFKLVREALAEGICVIPVPGASAVLAALVASGLPTDRFLFAGFLPAKTGERRSELTALREVPSTLVFFESSQRLSASLTDMAEIFGPRPAAVARELTKMHEEVRRAPLDELAQSYADGPPKGEIVVVIAPPLVTAPDQGRIDTLLRQALPFMPVKAAAALVAEATGVSRGDAYERALLLKQRPGPGDEPEA
jgi:16S rRNA (cytidine1402-2'-O)-methyltransferase